jgi:CRISPR-associated protein Csy1
MAALHDDPAQAKGMRDAFVSLTQPRNEAVSSHTLAKQLYWLTDQDACADADYTLLAPLYATSLAHAVYGEVQEARFGEVNKAARAAKRERRAHDNACLDYPDLAVQNMGGTKPQNISQLNSERRGMNYLLSSLPPQWKASAVRLPVNAASVFDRLFIARPDVRRVVKALRQFLESDPVPNLATRQHREALTDVLIDELVSLATELHRVMPPGWSRDDDRFDRLGVHEKLWLDPLRAELPEESDFAKQWLAMDWPEEIGKAFARWLNSQLRGKLPVGDVEAREWRKELLTDEDGFKQQLRTLRNRLGAVAVEAAP